MKWHSFERYLLLLISVLVGASVWYVVMSALNGRFLLIGQ